MNFRPNVDLSAAFDKIKQSFIEAERIWNDEDNTPNAIDRLRLAYAELFATVKTVIITVEKHEPVTKTSPL